jgi:hypothetical protein
VAMRRRLPRLALAAAPAAAVALVPLPVLPPGPGQDSPSQPGGTGGTTTGGTGQTGQFKALCRFSHRLRDDPIVFPRRPGRSHSHDFLGNRSTNARSTLRSLRAASALCRRAGDHSAYWAPTLYVGDTPVAPENGEVYYTTARRKPGTIAPFPEGLKVVAGHAHATGPQGRRVIQWTCVRGRARRIHARGRRAAHRRALRRAVRSLRRHRRALRHHWGSARRHRRAIRRLRRAIRQHRKALRAFGRGMTVPRCARGKRLRVTIHFPDCWDGRRVDSRDHASHLAYARWSDGGRRRTCPRSHPTAVPHLFLSIHYQVAGSEDVRLSSGPAYTMHADFFNAWDRATLRGLVDRCLNADVRCNSR